MSIYKEKVIKTPCGGAFHQIGDFLNITVDNNQKTIYYGKKIAFEPVLVQGIGH